MISAKLDERGNFSKSRFQPYTPPLPSGNEAEQLRGIPRFQQQLHRWRQREDSAVDGRHHNGWYVHRASPQGQRHPQEDRPSVEYARIKGIPPLSTPVYIFYALEDCSNITSEGDRPPDRRFILIHAIIHLHRGSDSRFFLRLRSCS